ncbi:sodium calcium exchanger protein [Rutstroemia sp. NJR-2017a BVV2]|nr:sodium calcium exchanger protein [Rutstroemia sp. NJR-2017a BVV2]
MQRISSTTVSAGRPTRSKYNFRAFYLTILFISFLAVISLVADQSARYRHGSEYGVAQKRALAALDSTESLRKDEECRLVHHAEDKCQFILANCDDETAGLLNYLSLYYCKLPKAKPIAFSILTLWLGLLFSTIGIAASDFFCINLSTIASILGMSESMAGVTFLAFGNGSPDVFSTFAAMGSHSGSLAVGELIGAAGFITAVVAGSMALVREFRVGKKTFVRDVGFFIVAASFSMLFLADGALHLWECIVMIAFYLFYVIVVVVWHWYLGRRRRHRERDAAARGQYLVMTNEELEVTEEDGDDEDAPAGQRGYRNREDFAALERGPSPDPRQLDGEDSDDDGERHAAIEFASNMRVIRPSGSRRNTITPIRPSLVGALEFRSVLSSLQKSRDSYTHQIHLRRYSDDPDSFFDQSNGVGSTSAPASEYASSVLVTPADGAEQTGDRPKLETITRSRAVSANAVTALKVPNPAAFDVADFPNIGIVAATPTFPRLLEVPAPAGSPAPASPTFSISPPPSANGDGSDDHSLLPEARWYEDRLAPPESGQATLSPSSRSPDLAPKRSSLDSARPRALERPRLEIPSSRDSSRTRTQSPILPFPVYTDSPMLMSAASSKAPSIMLPDSGLTPGSIDVEHEIQERPIKWWPYRILPSPHVLLATLFPTLSIWKDKSRWDKFISVISAPSIFLLAITLPVVESEAPDEVEEPEAHGDRKTSRARTRSTTGPLLALDSPLLAHQTEPEWMRYRSASQNHDRSRSPISNFEGHNTAAVAVATEDHHSHSHPAPMVPPKRTDPSSPAPVTEPSRDWNRWLVVLQLFTAPLFVVFIFWANSSPEEPSYLLRLVLYSLLGSLVAFAVLALTTTHNKPPKYRFLLCFLGFVVSIAWISTIANEVVGVLKAFGIILNISDAILGLTIFAVGNSLGDLVADITVARLGYPVMALSACFGGPMLNILLGIGISGAYMTIKDADHKHAKHPGKQYKYKPYQIDVSGTLMVSAITLLVTLVGLLIAVPMNNWMMSRKIGWGLIVLWSISTVINLAVEVSGTLGA